MRRTDPIVEGGKKNERVRKVEEEYTRRVISGEYGLGKRRLIAVDGGKIRGFFLPKREFR